MSYLSLYRKYRSQTFHDLVGQDHVVRTLQNGISSGRIAHAYLFTGPRGTGKTSTARLLAKALCCESGPTPTPDNTCEICQSITAGTCVDVIEMDAASEAGVNDVREKIVEVVEYQPMLCRYKVFIIDEVHDLSRQAFDALLKTIEEPPPHIIFILATTEYNKVPATIRSRCQKHEFHRASMNDLVARLQHVIAGENLSAEPAAITAIARMADGGYRDALTLLEQAILTADDGKVTLSQVYEQLGLINDEMVDGLLLAMKNADIAKIIDTLAEVFRLGRDPRLVIESLLYRLSDLTRAAYGVDSSTFPDATQEASMHETAAQLGRERLLALRSALSEAHRVIRDITLPRVWLESELVRIATKPAQASAPVAAEPSAVRKLANADAPPAQSKQRTEPTPPTSTEKPMKAAAEVKAAVAFSRQPDETSAPVLNGSNGASHAPVGTGDSALDEGVAVWQKVLDDLPSATPIGMRLGQSRVIAVKDQYLRVELVRKTDLVWLEEAPGRKSFIQKALDKVAGPGWQAIYVAADARPANSQVAAVELPAEGARLEQLAKDILAPDPSRESEI